MGNRENSFLLVFHVFMSEGETFWNHLGNRKYAQLLYPQCFLACQREVHLYHFQICGMQMFSFWNGLMFVICTRLISLPNIVFDWSKSKAFADQEINLTLEQKFFLGWVKKHCGKRRKCWLSAFSPFPTMFSKGFFPRVVKSRDCVVNS